MLDVETDGIHDCAGTADRTRHSSIIIYVGTERLDAGNIAGKQRAASVGMPRGDANREISILQMADNAAAGIGRIARRQLRRAPP